MRVRWGLLPGQAIALSLTLVMLLLMAFGFLSSRPRGTQLWDLGLFILASRAASLGLNPYIARPELLDGWETSLESPPYTPTWNPPHSVLMFQPAAWLDPNAQMQSFYLVAIAAYLVLVALLVVAYGRNLTPWRLLWMLALSPLWHTLFVANIYTIVALCAGIAWIFVERQR